MSRKRRKGIKQSEDQITRRRLQSLKTLYFNRFLVVRYAIASCFFGNAFLTYLGWGSWISYISLALLLASIYPAWELGSIFGKSKVKYQMSKLYCQLQWVFNFGLLIMIWTLPMAQVMPFLSDTPLARTVANALVGIGLILLSVSNVRFKKIDTKTDRVYQQIQFYEQKFGLHI